MMAQLQGAEKLFAALKPRAVVAFDAMHLIRQVLAHISIRL